MTDTLSISTRIDMLRDEAIAAGDSDQVAACERVAGLVLCDSETTLTVQPEDLYPGVRHPMVKYVDAIIESLDEGTAEGHVRVNGRRVFAQ